MSDQQNLDDRDAVGVCHLVSNGELAVSRLSPVILRFEDIDAALRVTGVELDVFPYFLVEALQPDTVGERSARNRFEGTSSLELHEPRVHQELTSFVNSPNSHGLVS